MLESYSPNIVRITLSLTRADATAAPGYSVVGAPSSAGWVHETKADGNAVVHSGELMIHIGADYPLFRTSSVYEDFRRDFGDSRRLMILARAAYLGAQRNGTVFWPSDIVSTWDMLKRSIPAGLNFTDIGTPYWDTDIAGFFSPVIPSNYHAEHTPLIDSSEVRSTVGITRTIPNCLCAGSNGEPSDPSCERMESVITTRPGPTANRPSPSSQRICVFAID